jgi:hypothetical protein
MSNWARRERRSMRGGNLAIAFAAGLAGTATVVVCIGLVIGAIVGGGDKRTPEDQVADQVDALFAALEAGNFEDTYRNDTTNRFRENVRRSDYLELGAKITSQFGALQSKTQTKFESQPLPAGGMQAFASYDGVFEKGHAVILAQFRKVDKKWLMENFMVEQPKAKQGGK